MSDESHETPSPAPAPKPGLLASITGALSGKNRAETELAASSAKVDELETELIQAATGLAALTSERDTLKADVASLTSHLDALAAERASLSAEVAALQAAAKTADQLAAAKTQDIVARLGVPAPSLVASDSGGTPETLEDVRKKIAATSDPKEKALLAARARALRAA